MKNENRTNIKIKHTERTSKQKTAFRKRVACVVVATVMAFDAMSIMPFSGLNINFPKFPSLFSSNIEATAATVTYSFDNGTSEYDISNTISITSVADFCKFSCWYNTYADDQSLNNSCVTLDLQLSGANFWDLYSTYTYQLDGTDTACQFYSLGTEDNPFYGVIKITGSNVDVFYSPVPLFDYVDQRTTIVDANSATKNIKLLCCERDADTHASSLPLLANYVVNPSNGTTAFTADVTLGYFNSGWNDYVDSSAKDFAGIIGEIGTDTQSANVALTVANSANDNSHIANVSNSGAVGLLCQKVNDDSVLNATINVGTNTSYTVNATTSYNAGGLVGEMASGSSLTVSGSGLNSVTQTITGNYAGGIVGYAEDAYIDSEVADSDSKMTVNSNFKTSSTSLSGNNGSGYLFGYYKNTDTSDRTIKLSSFTGLSVSATNNGNAGGLIGVLEHKPTTAGIVFTIDGGAGVADGASITQNLTITLPNDKANCGGVIGKYTTDALTNTLNITDVYAKVTQGNQVTTGGIIGYVDDTTSAAYISMSKIYAQRTHNNAWGGGLIGTAGGTNGNGVFLDVAGYVKIQGQFSGGLVHTIKYGVVRLEGITDLSGLTAGYYFVNTRDSALIYSPGTGEQTGTSSGEWRLLRQGHVSDDIGSWGEVVRLNGFTANAVVDESTITSDHYVSIESAVTSNISTVQNLVLLALNIQHNTSNTSETLVLNDTTNTSGSLLASTSSISLASGKSLDLSGTGITGLTRDNSSQTFMGALNGNGSTITLAIGEAYGLDSSGTKVSNNTTSNAGTGRIYNHAYNGLFSKTSGSSISNLTVTGTQWLGLNSGMYFGGISGQSEGGDSFDTVNSSVTVNVKRQGDNVRILAGGFIGRTNTSASGEIKFESCSSTASFRDDTWQNSVDKAESHFGGYIGLVDAIGGSTSGTNSPLTISFGTDGGTNTCAVGGGYVNELNTTAPLNSIYGGLIGTVRGNNSHYIFNTADTPKAFRTINAYGVTVDGLSINSKTQTASGGLLGYAWHDVEVNLQNVNVGTASSNTVEISDGSGTKLSGLVYNATGHWTVGTVHIGNITYTTPNAASSLGLLVNSTVNECRLNIDNNTSYGHAQDKAAGLLLEITNQANYTVDDTAALNIDTDVTVYDEIAAFSKNPDTNLNDIAANGNSIISINTDGSGTAITMTGATCNTYQNQSVYGKNTVKLNPNTRYYYNLDTIRKKASPENEEKVLLWSVYNYAHGTAVKKFFESQKDASISGSLDMAGLSYYPIDAVKDVGAVSKLKFYNNEIDTAEALTEGYDGVNRSTTNASSQHYMMHCGLFRNVSAGTSAASVSIGNITSVEGSVGIIGSGSGFFICGTLGGGTGVTTFGNGDSNTITLNGAYVNGASSSSFAPLLIANVDSNAVLNVNGVKSEGYNSLTTGTWYAATSLIGAVGKTDGSSKNMKLNFSKITLDSRKQNITGADNARLNTVYGSSRTIFKTATLLGHYYFDTSTDTDSEGIYNFTHDEDWGTETVNGSEVAKRQVTYGQEISGSHEYDGQQEKYYGSTYYADPTTDTNSSGEYIFSDSYFLPYVGNYNDANANYHEIKVNHSVVDLTVGCGTYNDPYVVDGGMLGTVSAILSGNMPDSTIKICLPDGGLVNKTPKNVNDGVGDINLLWCTGNSYHHNYHWTGSVFANDDVSKTYTKEIVQAYLAGAYYEVDEDINVEVGLSGSDKFTAFRGVIVGKQFTDDEGVTRYPTVTLAGAFSFIPTSNGSVIKNLNFEASANVTLDQTTATDVFTYNAGCQSYGVVIGKIMGGDNVIDNVGVTYSGTITSSTNAYIVPVGGYVGVVVNGGLFFRNMSSVTNKGGLTDSNFSDGSHIGDSYTAYLYHNPIIGRVINGYAVTESTSYVPNAASQTMKNGTKNYAITDIDKAACNGGANSSKILGVTTSAITVPDAQAWFIMSCIVNSGTGSGSSTNQQMANDNISYSITNYKPTHIGTYEDVGCGSYATKGYKNVSGTSTKICDSLIFLQSAYVEMGNKAAVTPYIIENYTSQSDSGDGNFYKHYAKSLSGSARSITLNPDYTDEDSDNYEVAAEWILPDGYRGVGNLHNTNYNITVSGMTCNNTTINLNMKYQTYLYSTTNKIYQENYYPLGNTQDSVTYDMGFGLFNTFKPYTTADITISNLKLKGNVYVDTLDKDTGRPRDIYGTPNNWKAYNSSSDDIRANTNGRVSAGMFAGVKYYNGKKLTLSNVALENINVHSSRCSGGIIGMAANLAVSSCPATNLTVLGKWDTGGYIGKATKTAVTISGTSVADKTSVTINSITNEALGHNYENGKRQCGVGGLVGKTEIAVTISNISITKYGSNGYVEKNLQGQDENGVGGFVGLCGSGNLTINNCSLTGISIVGKGANVGGVLGGLPGGSLIINNISLDGTGAVEGISVTNRISVGGIVGKVNGDVTITGAQLKNYTIKKTELAADHEDTAPNDNKNVGGCIGLIHGDKTIKLKDFLISDCVFKSPEAGRMSAIIGYMKSGKLQGYNVAENNITLASGVDSSWYTGDVYGAADSPTDREIKLVTFSRQNTPTNVLYPSTPKTTSYIIFSDYSGTGFDGAGQTAAATFNGAANTTPTASVAVNTPYANVNPAITIWSATNHNTVLTGDGIGSSYANLPISSIKSDLAINSNAISAAEGDAQTALTNRYNKRYNTVGTNITNNITADNFTTFNTEWGNGTVTNDFAMLLIEDTNRTNTTALINNYIQSLTNQTKYASFGADSPTSGTSSLIYKVNLYKMQLVHSDDGTYDYFAVSTDAHLSRNTTKEQFYMDVSSSADNVDSAEEDPTFTLMDVAFYDPTATSSQTVAYHLYIPIYVKKLLNFSFTIGSAANTPYYTTAYQNQMLMDNLGAAGSLYFTYTYERTRQEWQEALDYGENFLKSYNKTLNMARQGSTTTDFDDNTLIALVDANRGDKVYYARWSDVYSNGSLSMYNNSPSNFKTSIGSGTSFTPITINDLLNISATKDNTTGKFVKIDTSITGESIEYATVKIGDDYYRLKGSNENLKNSNNVTIDDDTAYSEFYTLTVKNKAGLNTQLANSADLHLTERYYISFFTKSATAANDTTINRYNVTSPDRISGGGSPAKASSRPEALDVLFGNLFNQTPVTYHANYDNTNPALIDDTNNTVKVKLESTIQLTTNAKNEISGLIGDSSVYQSFLVYLTRNDSGSLTKAILGSPTAVASYAIDPVDTNADPSKCPPLSGGSLTDAATGGQYAAVSNNYVEVAPKQNIAAYLVDGNGAKITSYVHITYNDPSKREAQFPGHSSENSSETNKFTYVTATSNIGFNPDTTALSKNQKDATNAGNTQMQYYIKSTKAPTLEYNAFADSEGNVYGQLGINARDLDDDTGKVDVKTEAVYDVSPIASDVSDDEYVKVTFDLKQKSQGYFDTYGNAEVIADYLENVVVKIGDTEYEPQVYGTNSYNAAGPTATEYSFILPRSAVATSGDSNLLTIPINFTVLTGSQLEGKGKMYSNYKITVTCQMLDTNSDESTDVQASYVTSYIIYTNAKLIKEYITAD